MHNLGREERNGKSIFAKVITPVLLCYFWGIPLAFTYFNYQYAQKNGFVDWIFFGEVIPSAQAFIWPYYALTNGTSSSRTVEKAPWTDKEKISLRHFINSINASLELEQMLNSGSSNKTIGFTKHETEAAIALTKKSLAEAELVDPDDLVKLHPDLPLHFKEEWLTSLKLDWKTFSGTGTTSSRSKSRKLKSDWVNWFNKSKIRFPKIQ